MILENEDSIRILYIYFNKCFDDLFSEYRFKFCMTIRPGLVQTDKIHTTICSVFTMIYHNKHIALLSIYKLLSI
jgi:hypothetical protein